MADELAEASAVELATRIRKGDVSSREVLDVLLDRVGRLDGPINAVVTTDVERAFADAAKADEVAAKGWGTGALHGVPMTIKDSWQTAGHADHVGRARARRRSCPPRTPGRSRASARPAR